jgi:hypothetical protein
VLAKIVEDSLELRVVPIPKRICRNRISAGHSGGSLYRIVIRFGIGHELSPPGVAGLIPREAPRPTTV